LQPLVNELADLEQNGMELSVQGKTSRFRVCLSCFTGGNLFLNSLLGFVESFTANFPCRHCVVARSEFSATFIENSDCIRTTISYDHDAALQSVLDTGIKAVCTLNKLTTFHAASNFVQDIMYDIFEGVCMYDMRLICRNLVSEGTVNLSDMNSRLQAFNYGYYDVSNRPPVITKAQLDSSEQLCMGAVQAWCFVRVFSLAVSDIVQADNNSSTSNNGYYLCSVCTA
jgi:hypothetical protein